MTLRIGATALNRRARLGIAIDTRWLATRSLAGPDALAILETCDGLFASPGSPYRSMQGALAGIEFARRHVRRLSTPAPTRPTTDRHPPTW